MPFRDVNNMWKETSRVCDDAGVINVPPSRIVIVKSTEFQAFDIRSPGFVGSGDPASNVAMPP